MKILMLNPPFLPKFSRSSRSPAVTKGGTLYYPYYLAYSTGVLEKNGFDGNVKLVDAVANGWNHEDTINFVGKFKPDLVVIDTSTPSIYNDVDVATKIKKTLSNAHITLVGTHPTRVTNETFSLSSYIDSICRDEYDYTVVDLAKTIENDYSLKKVDGLSFRLNKKIIHNKKRNLIKNLDELPFASEVYKKHLNIKDYFYASLKYPQVTILTARGCPNNCSFCNIPFKKSYRVRSVENVVKEFEFIQNELPEVKEVMIEDDTFPVSKKRTIEICNLIVKKKIKLPWSCNTRVDTEFDVLKKMKGAGCRLLCVGFETPTQNVLDNVHKRTTKEIQIKFMKNTRKIGILVNGCIIIGLPGDTKETVRDTIEFAKELNPDTLQIYPLYAYPGTELWDWAEKNGYLTSKNYSDLLDEDGLHKCNVNIPGFSAEESDKMCKEALKEFYLRKEYLIPKFKQIFMSFEEAKRTLISGKTFFKHLLLSKSHTNS
jgi:radical SAM superfamily enzyme YgiQ (UPF0313 family)